MSMPSLPPELWYHISKYLSPPSLSSLSQVCKALKEICIDKRHFRRHLRISQTDTNPALLYRRLQAWSTPHPQINYTKKPTYSIRLFRIVQDTLLLIDTDNGRLVSCPSGKMIDLKNLVGDVTTSAAGLARFTSCYAIIPDTSIAFINWKSPTTLTILNTSKWEVTNYVIPERKITTKAVEYDDYIVLAGSRGEYIMYFADDDTLVLVDWRTGQLVKKMTNIAQEVIYIHGECPAINRNTVVGLVKERTTESSTEVLARNFDGTEMKFTIDADHKTDTVLRSADTKTYVLVTCNSAESDDRQFDFIAYRKDDGLLRSWRGGLDMYSTLGLQNNGRLISSRHRHGLGRSRRGETNKRRLVYIELKDDGTTEKLYIPKLWSPGRAVWHRRTYDGGFAVVGSLSGVVQLVKLVKEENVMEGHILKSWIVRDLKNLFVLADHIIVAERKDGLFWWFHFDRFCRSSEDVSACPMSAKQIFHNAKEQQLQMFLHEIV